MFDMRKVRINTGVGVESDTHKESSVCGSNTVGINKERRKSLHTRTREVRSAFYANKQTILLLLKEACFMDSIANDSSPSVAIDLSQGFKDIFLVDIRSKLITSN